MPLAPGARFDCVFDLPREASKEVAIALFSWPYPGDKATKAQPVYTITTAGKRLAQRPAITGLTDNPLLPKKIRLQDAKRMDIKLEKTPDSLQSQGKFWTMGGKASDGVSGPPLFSVPQGRPVSLGLHNRTPTLKSFASTVMLCACCIYLMTAGILIGATQS